MDKNFENGCVLIVGGSGGIGSLCAKEFANSGAKIAITYFKNGGGGVDINPLNRLLGTPTIGFVPDSQRMFDIHHSDNDTFDTVHPRELELGTASIASLIYLIDKYGL